MRLFIIIWCSGVILLASYQLLAETVNHYGDICNNDTDCVDHRLFCKSNSTDNSQKFCFCIRFFAWNEEHQQCVQAKNMSAIMKSLLESRDVHHLNSMSEHETFFKLGVVGLISVVTLFIFIICCIAYGCCSCTRMDDKISTACTASCPSHSAPLLKGGDKWKDFTTTMPADFDDIDI